MTDPMKPLGLSFFLLTTRAPMHKAGGRLFVDVTQMLASSDSRKILLSTMGQHDPLMKDALMTIIERGDFIKSASDDKKEQSLDKDSKIASSAGSRTQIKSDPAVVSDLIETSQKSVEKLKQNIVGYQDRIYLILFWRIFRS